MKLNQKVSQWLLNDQGGIYALDGKGGATSERTICAKYDKFNLNGTTLTKDICQRIYKGSLQNNPLQATSIFMQDQFYSAIRFMSGASSEPTSQLGNVSDPAFLRSYIANKDLLEVLDA